jgi:esterase/lipase superfamily enzyme
MNANQVHNALKNDAAYNWSRANNSITNMMIVLRAHGYNCSYAHAAYMVKY